MIKRFLLPVSVAALMMSGTIAYGQEVPQQTEVVAESSFTTEEAGSDEVLGATALKYENFYYTVDKSEVTITGLVDANISTNIDLTIPSEINGMPVKKIAQYAFKGNANIKSVSLPEGLVWIGHSAFSGCVNITGTLTIPSTVEEIQGGNYWEASGAFQNTSINAVVVAEGNTSLDLGTNTFKECKALQSVTLSGRTETIGTSCFNGDMSLENVVFSKNGKLTTIDKNAFENTLVKALEFPDSLTKINAAAFQNCKSLESVIMGSHVLTIGESAFNGDSGLTKLELNEGLETIGAGAFLSCTNLGGKLVIPSTVTEIQQQNEWNEVGAFQNTAVTEVEFKNGNAALEVGYNTFRECKQLEKVTFPARIKRIGSYAFYNCTHLKDIVFTNGNNNLQIQKYAFSQTAVEDVVFPLNTTSVEEGAFMDCASLTGISLNEGLETIGTAAFNNCKSLAGNLAIPSTVTSIGGASSWQNMGAFQYTGIESIEIKDGNAGISIGDTAFRNCTNLRYAELSNRVKYVGVYSFAEDYKLAWVRISNGVYEAEIGENAFQNDTYLQALVLPRMCNIGRNILDGCTKLKDVYYAANETSYSNYAKVNSDNEVYSAATVHYNSNGPDQMPAITYTGWETVGDNKFWYENDILQGYDASNPAYRGKEIYDPDSDAWYWLDNVQGGAMAVSKDVYQESYAGEYADREDGTGKWVRYDKNGHMIKGFDSNDNGTYYFDEVYGAMVKGLQTIDGQLYYFDTVTGVMQSGNININGVEYAFNSDGTAVDKKWYTIDGKEYWYENGIRQGYKQNDLYYRGKEIYDPNSAAWYWLDNVQGGAKATSKDVFQESNGGKWVRYDRWGQMIKGWSYVSYNQYNYFDEITGAMYKGWHTIDGRDYYFDEETGLTKRY